MFNEMPMQQFGGTAYGLTTRTFEIHGVQVRGPTMIDFSNPIGRCLDGENRITITNPFIAPIGTIGKVDPLTSILRF